MLRLSILASVGALLLTSSSAAAADDCAWTAGVYVCVLDDHTYTSSSSTLYQNNLLTVYGGGIFVFLRQTDGRCNDGSCGSTTTHAAAVAQTFAGSIGVAAGQYTDTDPSPYRSTVVAASLLYSAAGTVVASAGQSDASGTCTTGVHAYSDRTGNLDHGVGCPVEAPELPQLGDLDGPGQ